MSVIEEAYFCLSIIINQTSNGSTAEPKKNITQSISFENYKVSVRIEKGEKKLNRVI